MMGFVRYAVMPVEGLSAVAGSAPLSRGVLAVAFVILIGVALVCAVILCLGCGMDERYRRRYAPMASHARRQALTGLLLAVAVAIVIAFTHP